MSDPTDCAFSIAAMVKDWYASPHKSDIPATIIDRRMARFQPSPALAALAMRERAAAMIETHVVETRFDGSRVVVPSPIAREDQHNRSLSKAIRALPTTFTNAELLAAARLLPEVQALEAIAHYFTSTNKDDVTVILAGNPNVCRGVIDAARAALAPFMKGAP